MTLDEFRAGDDELRCRWAANIIIGQNPRLRHGACFDYPVCRVLYGKIVEETELAADSWGQPIGPAPQQVNVITYRFEMRQALDGHPYVDLPVGQANYLHMYSVNICSAFGDHQAGDIIITKFNGTPVKTILTQEMIDETAFVLVRLGFST